MEKKPGDIGADWHTVDQLLRSQHYLQAADLLHTMQQVAQDRGESLVVDTAATIRQICLACEQCCAEVKWHQHAGEGARLREQQLQNHALTMLESVIGKQISTPTTFYAEAKSHSTEYEAHETEILSRLWPYLQNILQTIRHFIILESGLSPQHLPPQESGESSFPNVMTTGTASTDQKEVVPTPQMNMPVTDLTESITTSPPETAPATVIEEKDESLLETVTTPEERIIESEVLHQGTANEEINIEEAIEEIQDQYAFVVYCFDSFRVYQNEQLIEDWNGLKGLSIFKYLVAHRKIPVAKDILMDMFWPDAEPEAARRNLHQAIYSLRRTLRRREPDIQHIQFENNQYLINPELRIWVDVEEFEEHVRTGERLESASQLAEAIAEYSVADSIYQGDFLIEDIYEDWPYTQREHLRMTHMKIADRMSQYYLQQGEHAAVIALCKKILTLDNCDEKAHRRLMRCYLAQGHRHLAIRQYQICVQTLQDELDVPPSSETTALHEQIISLH